MIHKSLSRLESASLEYIFSERRDGDMRTLSPRQRLFQSINFPLQSVIYSQQIHGATVLEVKKSQQGQTIPNVDGIFYTNTLRPGEQIALAILTADCVPILTYETRSGVIGVAHSGWKGTLKNISSTLIEMFLSHGLKVNDIRVVIGPHIGVCCYSVPEERGKKFQQEYGNQAIQVREKSNYLDLGFIISQQLQKKGIEERHIENINICTACNNNRFFSFRQDSLETFGEQLGVLTLSRYN